jgi:hypothetical protein
MLLWSRYVYVLVGITSWSDKLDIANNNVELARPWCRLIILRVEDDLRAFRGGFGFLGR